MDQGDKKAKIKTMIVLSLLTGKKKKSLWQNFMNFKFKGHFVMTERKVQ